MPTSPAEPAPGIHRHRQIAESFGVDAARYDRARPPYPSALIDAIIAASPGRDVLDVGCGTGIEARQFQAAGCQVLGVEADTRMAEFARQTGVEAEVAKFEDWEPAGRAFDAVIAGTAWHWVDPVAGAAKAAAVLRPGGRLAPFHHVFQAPPEVLAAQGQAMRQVMPDSPLRPGRLDRALDAYQVLFDKIADGIRAAGRFTEPEQWPFAWSRTYTRAEWLDQLPTLGGLTRLTPDQLAVVQEATGAAIDALGGSFQMDYTTVAVTAVTLPLPGAPDRRQ
jgi:SAM-dependent methyltransferase